MANKLKYLNLYQKEYSAFRALEKLPKRTLQKMGFLAGLDMDFYNRNKKLLAKGIFIALGAKTPVNFDKW